MTECLTKQLIMRIVCNNKQILQRIYIPRLNYVNLIFTLVVSSLKSLKKQRKATKIGKQYNQVPHLTQNTTCESDKTQLNITNKSPEVSPYPAGDHKAAMNRRESMKNTINK